MKSNVEIRVDEMLAIYKRTICMDDFIAICKYKELEPSEQSAIFYWNLIDGGNNLDKAKAE